MHQEVSSDGASYQRLAFLTLSTRRHNPEDANLYLHRRENSNLVLKIHHHSPVRFTSRFITTIRHSSLHILNSW